MILTARGPEQQAQGVNNALAYINVALALGAVGKPAAASARSPVRATARAAASTGRRPISCPATGASTIPPRAVTSPRSGTCPESEIPQRGQVRLRAARRARHRGPRAVRDGLRTRSSRRRTRSASSGGCVRSTRSSSPTSSCPKPRALADVVLPAAQWAEEDGTMTNLEGRVIRRRRAIGAARRACGPTSRSSSALAATRSGRADGFRLRMRSRGLRRAAARDRGRPGRLLRHHLRADRRGRRRVLAVPGRRASGHAAPLRRPVPDAGGRARFHATPHARSPTARRRVPAATHDRPRARALPVGHADAAHRGAAGGRAGAARRNASGRRARSRRRGRRSRGA